MRWISHRDPLAAHCTSTLSRCLTALKPGDVLIVWKLDRLGRNVHDIVNILHNLEQLGIGFQSLVAQHRVFKQVAWRKAGPAHRQAIMGLNERKPLGSVCKIESSG